MLAEELLDQVRTYVEQRNLTTVLGENTRLTVSFLAQGEYNLNYLLRCEKRWYVLRINTGSQMQLENQISYEYRTLKLLEKSGVTPKVYYVDESKQLLPYGVLVMEYISGEPLDYRHDLVKAARTLAGVHSLEFAPSETQFLVKVPEPFSAIWQEATQLLEKYFSCPKANTQTRRLLEKMVVEAEKRKDEEKILMADPWSRVINTEVNSHNFIVDHGTGACCLIDWEKPLWGEPAQDLAHFLIPTTTLWKRDYALSHEEEEMFIGAYLKELSPRSHAGSLQERMEMFKFFNLLRALSWCAMAWTEYVSPDRPLYNQDTFKKINDYLEPDFIKKILIL